VSRRVSAAIAVAFLLVLAGCGGVAFDDPAPTTDPPTTGSTPNSTVVSDETLGDAEFPEGFSRSEIDIATARRLSVTFLRTEPVSGVALERFRPGAYADYQYEASATRTRFRLDVHNGYADVSQSDVYVESNVRHSRSGRSGQAAFEATNGSVDETRVRAADSMWAVVSRTLTIGEFRAVEVTESADGRRIRYAITDVAVRNATDVQGYLTVDENGVIREAQLLYSQAGEPKRFQYSVTPRPAKSVAPPAWLPAARADGRFESEATANAGSTANATNNSDSDLLPMANKGSGCEF